MNEDYANSNASIVKQGFDGDELYVQHETAATAIAAAAEATIKARYVLAMRRPRDIDVVRTRLLKECKRPGFAEAALYRKPVGNKKNEQTGRWEKAFIEGLSVRFAEAAIRSVTNFYASATSIYDDPQKGIVRVTVMDLETNATIETDVHVSKTVERRSLKDGQQALGQRLNSYGDVVYIVQATDDEVLNKTNALVSKALRNGVLRLLPGDIQDECEAQCRATQAKADKEDPEAARKKLFDGFAAIGIMPNQLKEYLGHNNDLQPAELRSLRGIYSAIRDGETTWQAIVDAKEGADPKPVAKPVVPPEQDGQRMKLGKKAQPKAAAEPEQPTEPAEREPGMD